ncbi:UNVERIFIED_CONTAM: ABC-type transport system involved in multi-copper enzyme maturation permease subunit [Paenibacillus sp. PvR008]
MLKLMKLELRRNKINSFIFASLIACIVLIGFIYFASVVAKIENEIGFKNYANLFLFTLVISMIIFCMLSSIMYSRFVIEEYTGKKLILNFSYPVNRKKMLLAKMMIVILFTTVAMIICTLPAFIIFSITESIEPIVKDTLSLSLLLSVLKTVIVSVICINGISIIAMRIGFSKKSIPATMVSAFILCGMFGNGVIGSVNNNVIVFILLGVIVMASVAVIFELMKKIDHMEIE